MKRGTGNGTWRGIAMAAILGAGLALGRAEITLTDVQGRKATVEVTEATPAQVAFVIQGRKGAIKMAELSEESRAAVVAYSKAKNLYRSFPPVIVQVKVTLQRRADKEIYYKTNAKLLGSVVIEGTAKLVALPAAEATMVLITQDTRMKYVENVEKLKVHATDSVSIPAADSGARREFPFKTAELTYDNARDYTNAGGDEYKYYIFGLRDPETKQLIDFQSNCPAVQRYAASHPEARETLLGVKKGAPFSTKFAER